MVTILSDAVVLFTDDVESFADDAVFDWNESDCDSASPENMETGRWKRNVTFEPELVNPVFIFTIKRKKI